MRLRFINLNQTLYRAGQVYDAALRMQSRMIREQKKARRFLPSAAPNYTHRRKGVFNVQSIEDLAMGGNVRYRTETATKPR